MKKKIIFFIIATVCVILTTAAISKESNDEYIVLQSEPITYETEVIEVDSKELARQEVLKKMEEINFINDKMEWFVEYKKIICNYIDVIDPPETVFDYFTEDEVRLICRVVETETYDQEFIPKVNVANVVFNRYYSGKFGDTITEIITTPYQFAYGRENITESTILAVMYAFEIEDTTNGALFFHSNPKTETFCGADYIFSDTCGHNFYK